MSAVVANLKALLRPGFLFNAGYLFLVSIAMFFWIPGNPSDSTSELKSYGFGLIFPWIQGLFTGMMVLEIMTKPFGFGLPGYSLVIRRMLFILGLGFSTLPALLFLFFPELEAGAYFRVIFAALCMGLMCFWLGVAFSFHRTIFSLICIGFVVYLTFSDGFVVLNRFTQCAIVNHSWATIAIGLLVCGIAWMLFGQEDILRAYARRNWGRFPSSFDKTGRWRYSREKNRQLPIRPGWISVKLERFFLRRMKSCTDYGWARFFWGQLYIVLAPSAWGLNNEGLLFIGVPLLIVVFGFAGGEIAMIICFIWILNVSTTMLAYSSLIHVGGRREKWIATMLCAAVISILVTALIVGFAS